MRRAGIWLLLAVATGGLPSLTQAQQPTDATADKPLAALGPATSPVAPAWKQLSARQRTNLARYAEHWDDLPPRRRLQLIEWERRWQSLPPKLRQAMREGRQNFQRLSPEQREKMRASIRAVRQLPPEQQESLRQTWRGLTPEQRRSWLDRGGPGIAPPPQTRGPPPA